MRTELVKRWSTVLFHAKDGVKPVGGLELVHVGNLGISFSLRGKSFYENITTHGWANFKEAGIDTLLCAVSKKHLRLIRIAVKGNAEFKHLGTVQLDANTFELIVLRDPAATTANPFANVKE